MSRIIPLGLVVATLGCSPAPRPPAETLDADVPVDVSTRLGDLPAAPIIEPGLPPNIGELFGDPGGDAQGGPCLTEPAAEAMYPTNWTPPVFEWTTDTANVYELRLVIPNQTYPLRAYSTTPAFTIPDAIWANLAGDSAGQPVTVSVRSATLAGTTLVGGPYLGSVIQVYIAPVSAPGAVVYWSIGSGDATLQGFDIGQAASTTVVTPGAMNDGTVCVGCHTSSPDGKLAFMTRTAPGVDPYSVDARTVDGTSSKASPVEISDHAYELLARQIQGAPTLSAAHYSDSDAVAVTVFDDKDGTTGSRYELTWTDLHATTGGTGMIARTGDPRQVATPEWSNDGNTIYYVSTDGVIHGRPTSGAADIYTVPYNGGAGGDAVAVAGASEPDRSEYYPALSPDDAFLAFNAAPTGNMYSEPRAEVFVVPAGGGTPVRIAGNDALACTGKTSPGLTNSWPRWAPSATHVGDLDYYWLVFSSRRHEGTRPQLYVAGLAARPGNPPTIVKTYGAIYVTAQVADAGNHTPSWDNFGIILKTATAPRTRPGN